MCTIHTLHDKREIRGREIAEKYPNQIKKINRTKFLVKSQTKKSEVHVVFLVNSDGSAYAMIIHSDRKNASKESHNNENHQHYG